MTPHSPPANNLSLGTPRLRTRERGESSDNLSLGPPRLRTHERTVRPAHPANNLSLGTPRLRTHEHGAYTLRPAHPADNLSLGTPRLRTHERGADTVRPGDRGRRRGTQRGDQGSRADAPSSLRTEATGLVKEPWQSTRDEAASTCPGGPRVARDQQSVGPRSPARISSPRARRARDIQHIGRRFA